MARIQLVGSVGGLLVMAAALCARAEIVDIQANVNSEVREFVAGQEASFDDSKEGFPETSNTLPIQALAGLGEFDEPTDGTRGARGIADFADPRLSATSNPEEFGLEAVSFSRADVHYVVDVAADELRTIVFSADELASNRPGPTGSTSNRLVSSTVFLSGAVVVWSQDPNRDLSGLSAAFDFVITQQRPSLDSEVVFDATVLVEGTASGEVQVTQSSILGSVLGGPELLTQLLGESAAGVVADLETLGNVHILLLPTQPVAYAYEVAVGEEFTLLAETRINLVNLPAGTGAAAVFGRPFTDLAATIQPSLKAATGPDVQRLVNRAIQQTQPPAPAATPASTATPIRTPFCGSMGAEALLLPAVGFGLFSGRRRLTVRR